MGSDNSEVPCVHNSYRPTKPVRHLINDIHVVMKYCTVANYHYVHNLYGKVFRGTANIFMCWLFSENGSIAERTVNSSYNSIKFCIYNKTKNKIFFTIHVPKLSNGFGYKKKVIHVSITQCMFYDPSYFFTNWQFYKAIALTLSK